MSERAPYSRVYWAIADDPKFATIYDDNNHLATWLRLLIGADALWPASCPVPASATRGSLKALVDAELVDLVSGGRYRIHGLDAERGRRRDAARTPPGRDPNGPRLPTVSEPNGVSDRGLSRDELHRDAPMRARNSVSKDPLLAEMAASIRDKYGSGMDEQMDLPAVDIRKSHR